MLDVWHVTCVAGDWPASETRMASYQSCSLRPTALLGNMGLIVVSIHIE